jgi:hypothetical protein
MDDDESGQDFAENEARECSVYFGKQALDKFRKANAGL